MYKPSKNTALKAQNRRYKALKSISYIRTSKINSALNNNYLTTIYSDVSQQDGADNYINIIYLAITFI